MLKGISYDIICEIERTEPSNPYCELPAQPESIKG